MKPRYLICSILLEHFEKKWFNISFGYSVNISIHNFASSKSTDAVEVPNRFWDKNEVVWLTFDDNSKAFSRVVNWSEKISLSVISIILSASCGVSKNRGEFWKHLKLQLH